MLDGNSSAGRVAAALRREVRAKAPGAGLPSVRELMATHGVGPGTAQRALSELKREGLVRTQPGRGTFVAEPPPRSRVRDLGWQSVALGTHRHASEALAGLLALPPPGASVLSSGYLPDDLQPTRLLASALTRAARRPGVWDRIPVEGLEPLRAWFAADLGAGMSAREVMICPGTQAALACAFRALAPPGSAVLLESPAYVGALAAAHAAGLQVAAVPCDADGVRPELLERALRSTGARVFYGQPLHANPHGGVLAPARRAQVLALLHEHGAFMIEDDWARDLCLEGEPPPPLAAQDEHGHVVYVRSLTKPAAPGLRIGALAGHGPVASRLRAARVVEDFFVAGPLQEAALDVVTSPGWPRHLRSLTAALRARRDALLAGVDRHLPAATIPVRPRGGLHLWVRLPDGTDEDGLVRAALAAGVLVSGGRQWFPGEAPGPFLRLTYAAAPPTDLDCAARRLGEIAAPLIGP